MVNEKEIIKRDLSGELEFQYTRSSGPGGQHVNRTESKVELRFHIEKSLLLSIEEKEKLMSVFRNRINKEGYFSLTCQVSRSQFKNKELVMSRFYSMIGKALQTSKKRIPTTLSKHVHEKRIEEKKKTAEKKERRRKTDPEQ